ncbi:MAG TPA: DUF624 domain-containing protein [Thermoflexales bacterium]|nr:DUF624 domain-containing protein [Thermoflexales bacterium]HQW35648.1 DUF624 domain-containing protein [Thermoflexales bacterium]HQZ21231.1 DUF624 domain-containing protein [Thermoflexales bacterium]HQZ99335.1 DUF624 domain-containing protein [Thermoflexales bacterium]
MLNPFRVIWRAFRQIWDDMLILVLMNLFTLVCTLVIIPGPAAWVALNAMCNRCANLNAISWEKYFEVFKENLWKAWKFALPSLLIIALIVFNFFWYPTTFGDQQWVPLAQGAWLSAAFFWVVVQLYVTPFYAQQEDKSWRTALRNTVIIAGTNPIYTAVVLLITLLLMALCLFLFPPMLVFLGHVWWCMVGNTALVDRVQAHLKRQETQSVTRK